MDAALLKRLEELKSQYEKEGFIILGLFGSFARGEETPQSDIDLLYEVDPRFIHRYGGWGAVSRLESLKEEMKEALGRKVDLAARNSLGRTGERFILPELIRV